MQRGPSQLLIICSNNVQIRPTFHLFESGIMITHCDAALQMKVLYKAKQ